LNTFVLDPIIPNPELTLTTLSPPPPNYPELEEFSQEFVASIDSMKQIWTQCVIDSYVFYPPRNFGHVHASEASSSSSSPINLYSLAAATNAILDDLRTHI